MQPVYKPSDAVKQQLTQVELVAVVGPTGVGKTTIMERSGIPFVTSDVTRDARKGETNGVDYNFRTDYETIMQELEAGEFVQYVVNPNGEFYGTKASSYPESGPCTMSIVATAVPLFHDLGFRNLVPVYIIPPSYDEWMKRMNTHHDKDTAARLIEAKTSIETALAAGNFHFMINDNLDSACELFRAISRDETTEHDDQVKARQAALQLLTGIGDTRPARFLSL